MTEFDKMLVVGFDGLDYERIQKFDCDNLMQKSFGKMSTGGFKLKTPSLWASLITGVAPEEHGIDRMLTFRGEEVRKWDNRLLNILERFGMSGLHLRKFLWYYIFESSILVPDRDFMKVDSIFEKVADSVALDVPGYSEYPYIAGKSYVTKAMRKRPPVSKQRVFRDMRAEHLYRKKQLFDNINKHKLVMQHLHYPDWYGHLYLNKEEKEREMYAEMNELAGEILEKADDDTLVVFCSDHGMEGGGHRDQAFYSVNTELEGKIKITNLLFKCLEKVDYEEEENAIEELEI